MKYISTLESNKLIELKVVKNDKGIMEEFISLDMFYEKLSMLLIEKLNEKKDDNSIFKILESGYLPNVIFTTNEEIGSLGAKKLIEDFPECPFSDLRYLIQLDRENEYDCVFYLCENKEFIPYVESFGFVEAFGTSTDIKHICPVWDIAGVNLSIGYNDQHTENETLDITIMFNTISKVKEMLDDSSNVDIAFKFN